MSDIYNKVLNTALQLQKKYPEEFGNFYVVNRDTAARILAVAYLQGGDERFTASQKLKDDLAYIQDTFDIHGGETMDAELHRRTKVYIRLCEDCIKELDDWPVWVYRLFEERYGFKPYKL